MQDDRVDHNLTDDDLMDDDLIDDSQADDSQADHTSADAADLRTGLAELAGLITGSTDLPGLLSRVAASAARAIRGADGAGVTLLRVDEPELRVEAIAASAAFVDQIDELQYEVLDEGPCITAARERRTIRSGSLGGEQRWPRFGPRVARMGVHSVLSLPLLLPHQVVGAINVYAHAKGAFDARAAEIGEQFAAPAAVAVHNAQVLARAVALTRHLQATLATRPIIDQAIGIVRSRIGGSADEVFDSLRTTSQREHTKVVVVAQHIVDEAVRSAIARRQELSPHGSPRSAGKSDQ